MSGHKLRDYQEEAVQALRDGLKSGLRSPAVILPTGGGKTEVFSSIVATAARNGSRVLVFAHRTELIQQAYKRLERWLDPGISLGVVQGRQNDSWAQVVVASVQTLNGADRLAGLGVRHLIVCDEAHHATSATYERVFEHFNRSVRLGFTATMMRGDGKALGKVWDEVVYERTLIEMIEEGYLVEPRGKLVTIDDLHMENVAVNNGDYAGGSLAAELKRSLAPELVAKAYLEHASDRLGILFAPTVDSSYEFADALVDVGIPSAVVHGGMNPTERSQIFADFRPGGPIQVLCNCNVTTEGYDNPAISCVVMARPTKSQVFYTQAVGRGLRLFPGKDDALVMDVAGVSRRMKIVGLTDLVGAIKKPSDGVDPDEQDLALDEEKGPRPIPDDIYSYGDKTKVVDVELFASSKRAWERTPAGHWYLPGKYLDAIGTFFIYRNSEDPGLWDAYFFDNHPRASIVDVPGGPMPIKDIQKHVEKLTTAGWSKKSWGGDGPSQAQVAKLVALGVPTDQIPATKREVSRMISMRTAAARIDGLRPRVATMEAS